MGNKSKQQRKTSRIVRMADGSVVKLKWKQVRDMVSARLPRAVAHGGHPATKRVQ